MNLLPHHQSKSQPPQSKAEEAFDAFCALRLMAGVSSNLQAAMRSAPQISGKRGLTKKRYKVRGHYRRDSGPKFMQTAENNLAQRDLQEQKFRRLFDKLTVDEKQEFYELREEHIK